MIQEGGRTSVFEIPVLLRSFLWRKVERKRGGEGERKAERQKQAGNGPEFREGISGLSYTGQEG